LICDTYNQNKASPFGVVLPSNPKLPATGSVEINHFKETSQNNGSSLNNKFKHKGNDSKWQKLTELHLSSDAVLPKSGKEIIPFFRKESQVMRWTLKY
jgi:hypothetical protein